MENYFAVAEKILLLLISQDLHKDKMLTGILRAFRQYRNRSNTLLANGTGRLVMIYYNEGLNLPSSNTIHNQNTRIADPGGHLPGSLFTTLSCSSIQTESQQAHKRLVLMQIHIAKVACKTDIQP